MWLLKQEEKLQENKPELSINDKISEYRKTHKDCRICEFCSAGDFCYFCKVRRKTINFPFLHKFCETYKPKEKI
jgi:recombinational DNA repair protein RecR